MAKRKPKDEGLATLLPPRPFPAAPLIPGGGAVTRGEPVLEIPLDSLDANPYQTRTSLDEKSLDELASSIAMVGLLEPIVVRASGGGRYQVIAGERRVKACYMAGVYKIPAVVRQVTNEQAAEMTVIENLLREDVDPMDQAHGFSRLMDEFGLSPDQIADRTGKSRSAVANFLRLLQLPRRVQDMVRSGKLSPGHARALLALENYADSVVLEFAERAASLSVRETEKLIAEVVHRKVPDPTVVPGRWLRPELREAQQEMRSALGAEVVIVDNGGRGHIRIPFADLEELERLHTSMTGSEPWLSTEDES